MPDEPHARKDDPSNGTSHKLILPLVVILIIAAAVWCGKEYLRLRGRGTDAAQAATASLTVSRNGGAFVHSVTANVGDTLTYRWSSTNGVSYTSLLAAISPGDMDGCSNLTGADMGFNTSGNTTRAYPLIACQAGYTYTITYTVTAANGATAGDKITIAVTGKTTSE